MAQRIPHISEPLVDAPIPEDMPRAGAQKVNDNWFRFFDGLAPVTGEWTPVLTFETPGDLVVVYDIQIGTYERIGRLVHVAFEIVTSTFTHSSAAGNVLITGLPFTNGSPQTRTGPLRWGGITKATYTDMYARLSNEDNFITVGASGSGVARDTVDKDDMPTGGDVALIGSIIYAT